MRPHKRLLKLEVLEVRCLLTGDVADPLLPPDPFEPPAILTSAPPETQVALTVGVAPLVPSGEQSTTFGDTFFTSGTELNWVPPPTTTSQNSTSGAISSPTMPIPSGSTPLTGNGTTPMPGTMPGYIPTQGLSELSFLGDWDLTLDFTSEWDEDPEYLEDIEGEFPFVTETDTEDDDPSFWDAIDTNSFNAPSRDEDFYEDETPEDAPPCAIPVEAPWSLTTSPFYARSLGEAKYRAWLMAPENTRSETPVGALVAQEFEVAETSTWEAFFPMQEYEALKQQRTTDAAGVDMAVLRALHTEWNEAYHRVTYNRTSGVGEEVAARWRGEPGFSWVDAATSWEELYPIQAYQRYHQWRTTPIAKLDLGSEWATLATAGMPVATYRFLSERQLDDVLARDVLTKQLRENLLPRLRLATPEELASYVGGLSSAERLTLRYALDFEMARLTDLGGDERTASLLLCQQIYSEMHHTGDASAYGVHQRNGKGLLDVVADIEAGGEMYNPSMALVNRGSYAQRVAFLADTDYSTFLSREAQGVASWLTQENYYTARSLLLQAMQQGGGAAINPLLDEWFERPVTEVVTLGGTATESGANLELQTELRIISHGKLNPIAAPVTFVFNHYLRGGNSQTTDDVYFNQDRYHKANLGLTLLPGWQNASEAQRNTFADALYPLDREALLGSLKQLALSSHANADKPLAENALTMALFIQDRFKTQWTATTADTALNAAYVAAGTMDAARYGVPQEYRADYERLAESIKRVASFQATQAFLQWRMANPIVNRYNPVFGLEIVDRAMLNAAEFISPVYKTAERLIGLGKGLVGGDTARTNHLADIDEIRRVISGDFDARLGPQRLGNGVGEVLWDGALTLLTILPIGTGIRATISGGKFLPGGLGLARNQVLSASRHLATVVGAGASSALAMSIVEVVPMADKYKGALRFAVGLGAGIGSGLALNKLLPQVESTLLRTTQDLAQANLLLKVAKDEIAALRAASKTVPAELLAAEASLARQVTELTETLDKIRLLGGDKLTNAEKAFELAHKKLAELEAKAGAEGLAPSARAALRKSAEMKAARAEFKKTTSDLSKVVADTDLATAMQAITISRRLPRITINLRRSSNSNVATTGSRSTPVATNDEITEFFRKMERATGPNGEPIRVLIRDEAIGRDRQIADLLVQQATELVGTEATAITALDSATGKMYVVFRNRSSITQMDLFEELLHVNQYRIGMWNKKVSLPDATGVWMELPAFETRELDAAVRIFRAHGKHSFVTDLALEETLVNLQHHLGVEDLATVRQLVEQLASRNWTIGQNIR